MTELIRLAALALLFSVLGSVLDQYNRAAGIVAATGVCCLFLLYSVQALAPLVTALARLADTYSSADFGCVVKAVGVAILTQGAADICTDAGQKAVAGRVVLAGRIAVLAAAFPLFGDLIDLLTEMLR